MIGLRGYIDSTFYGQYERNWDDQLFRERILALLDDEKSVLDVGAGAGIVEQMNFRDFAKEVCGVDLDQRVQNNPFLDEGRIASGDSIPYPDERFDIVISDNVLEHLENPELVFNEIARVLKPGGSFLFKTPNKFHYMPLIARLTPHGFHQFINRLRGRDETDTFPTLYRANSRSAVRQLSADAGLAVDVLETVEGRPEYMRIFAPLYILGMFYERLVNLHRSLSAFRILLIGQLRKPADG